MISFNVMSWTQGIGIFQKRQPHDWRTQLKKIILNPNIIAIIIGLFLFIVLFGCQN
ncbi:transporter [Limosilactobacillus reuteri]|uniref:Transporter n=1 Tax=Limosilactobacillus reuteri TaxID=1598 RepID=A0A2S1EUL8_LIMRT|nr:transporter [Limosilactobacillus reuteri]